MNDILFGNNNGAVIKKLSGRYFKASKSRNIIAIIAIVLTTILFTTIFTLGSGLMDTVHDQNIRKAGGEGQAVLNYISDKVYNDVAGSPLIDRIAYTKAVSYRLKNPGLERWRSDLWYMDDTALEFARYTEKGENDLKLNVSFVRRVTGIGHSRIGGKIPRKSKKPAATGHLGAVIPLAAHTNLTTCAIRIAPITRQSPAIPLEFGNERFVC